MYTATAIYQNCEVGYGEGEGDAYTIEECIDSIPSIYKELDYSGIRLIVRRDDGSIAYVTNLAQYWVDTH